MRSQEQESRAGSSDSGDNNKCCQPQLGLPSGFTAVSPVTSVTLMSRSEPKPDPEKQQSQQK